MDTTPSRTFSRIQCHRMSTCLECLWNCRFRAIAIDLSLSPMITVGVLSGKPNSLCRFLNQQASHASSDKATYSASVDNSAIISCFLDHHVIAPPATKKTYPDVDLRSSVLAYAASANPIKEFTGMFGILYVIPYDLIPDKYHNSLLRIPICCKLGFAVYDASLFTTNAISGRVAFVRYWSSPSSRAYELL